MGMMMIWSRYLDTRESDSRWGVRADHQGDEGGPKISKHVGQLTKKDRFKWLNHHTVALMWKGTTVDPVQDVCNKVKTVVVSAAVERSKREARDRMRTLTTGQSG